MYPPTETFLIKKLEKYKTVEVKVERIIESLFVKTYKTMTFEQKMDYMKSSPNRNIEGLPGVYDLGDVKIKLTSKTNKLDETLDCTCIAVTSDGGNLAHIWGTEYDNYVGYLFTFDIGYIEVLYVNYYQSDFGSLFKPYSSEIVINGESFDGFFKEYPEREHPRPEFMYQYSLYEFIKDHPILEFNIGLKLPSPDDY